jgi:hypothetical protein
MARAPEGQGGYGQFNEVVVHTPLSGRVWPRVKEVAEQVRLIENLKALITGQLLAKTSR